MHDHGLGHVLVHHVILVRLVDVAACGLVRGRWFLVLEVDHLRHPVLELEPRVLVRGKLLKDWLELAGCVHLLPVGPDVGVHRLERLMQLLHARVPPSEVWERSGWAHGRRVEELGPGEDTRQHILHEDTRGKPRQVRQCQLLANHVGPRPSREFRLKPVELLPDLSELGAAALEVHPPRRAVPTRRQVHGALGVGETRGRAVWRGDVEVVDALEELHLLASLRCRGPHGWPAVGVLVLEIVEDDAALEDCLPIRADECRYLLERVDGGELLRLQIGVAHDARFYHVLHHALPGPLEHHPQSHARGVVGVDHVEKYGFG
mmetsp:Transcript_28287/g.76137  ORF Transcript_28287/g.76137 Transcript_28287/m.76137 type:complete len:319 (+) Transcript_28287:1221-2177(+)